MKKYSEEVVNGVLRQLADEGNVITIWTEGDIINVIRDPFNDLKLTTEQEAQVVKRVQGSPEWLTIGEAYDDDWEQVEDAVRDAIEELGFKEGA